MSLILFSLGISAMITLATTSLEYALRPRRKPPLPRMDDLRVSTASYGDEEIRTQRWGNVRSAPVWTWHSGDIVENQSRCEYCKSVQSVGAHCLNCGAPVE